MANLITEKIIKFDIPDGKKKERIDVFLANSIENASRSRVQKFIESSNVTVNGKEIKANYKVVPGDHIVVTIPVSPRPDKTEPEDIPLDIIYEDEYLIIVNKPPGMTVHPSFGHFSGTLVNALLYHTKSLSDTGESIRPGIVHRIDKDTSGILIVAKDNVTHAKIASQFSQHNIDREYWAVVWGRLDKKSGTIQGNIARSKKDRKKFAVSENEGKRAVTHYEVLEEFDFATLIKLKLETGRTHQIRVHLSHINHPVFGDETYGGRVIRYGSQLPKMKSRVDNLLKIMQRQALHAKTLGFFHPHKEELVYYDSNLPEDFAALLENLREN